MDCPICGLPQKVLRTYQAGAAGRSVERRCPNDHRHVYAVQLVGEVQGRGTGAYAVAKKMERGEDPVPENDL